MKFIVLFQGVQRYPDNRRPLSSGQQHIRRQTPSSALDPSSSPRVRRQGAADRLRQADERRRRPSETPQPRSERQPSAVPEAGEPGVEPEPDRVPAGAQHLRRGGQDRVREAESRWRTADARDAARDAAGRRQDNGHARAADRRGRDGRVRRGEGRWRCML